MRIFLRTISILFVTGFFQFSVNAQKPTDKKTATVTQKFKPLKLTTQIGTYKDSISVPVAVAEILISQPIKVFDENKTELMVSSYQFLYRKRGVTEDEQTGKISPASSVSSDRFKVTPLPGLWINTIKEQLKTGEELYFFDIIAKDAKGRVMYASNLKIMIQ